jgi:hypothetical protein
MSAATSAENGDWLYPVMEQSVKALWRVVQGKHHLTLIRPSPEWDSNPHYNDFKSFASAIGLPGVCVF